MRLSRLLWIVFLCLLAAVGVQSLLTHHAPAAEDLPWTPLDLRAPIGLATPYKLAALADDAPLCSGLLRQAGIRFDPVAPRRAGETCGWNDAVRLASTADAPRPDATLSCPLAAAFDLWMRRVVQPAAMELLGADVRGIESLGSYSCRRTYGRSAGRWSQHAFANAIDIAGFRLSDGRLVTLSRDWRGDARGRFLHRVRDGACRLFATTLSPDYNAAHHDHLHLDMAPRGAMGWRMCG
ncbi:extensin family protein [Sphingomonas sp. AP4-R1]|uniref:extensin-like domain-containing protein n=1 Tax=Sphingomonas sp. AP4-R1 TaxID=2735134 RepID=UPI0014933E21|nr:extensin family protein [Sphingomonas sp. AP4-R1]QJU58777.1 extensin family protein [Sphingomonas sp. AP4-R1]